MCLNKSSLRSSYGMTARSLCDRADTVLLDKSTQVFGHQKSEPSSLTMHVGIPVHENTNLNTFPVCVKLVAFICSTSGHLQGALPAIKNICPINGPALPKFAFLEQLAAPENTKENI